MGSPDTAAANRKGARFIPDVGLPRQSFIDKLSPQDHRLLVTVLREPVECVYLSKFRLVSTERVFFGPPGRAVSSVEEDRAALATLDQDKFGSDGQKHSVEKERFLFERYNLARFHIWKLLREREGKALTAKAARLLLIWARRAHSTRCEIIQVNMPLVLSMIKRSRLVGLDYSEMISEGNLALIRSVEKFDTSRGFKFSTYSCRAILKSFSRVAMRAGRYRGMFPVELTIELEKSDFIERKRERIEEDFVDDLKQVLTANLANLNEVEHTVIKERFALEPTGDSDRHKTLEQVGLIIGVTKERVRQIQNKALKKIKVALEEGIIAA